MKKNLALLLIIAMLASVLASCAKPIDDPKISQTDHLPSIELPTDNTDYPSNGDDNGNENNENNEDNEDNENNGGEVATPDFPPPANAQIYNGTPDTSWYVSGQTEYTLTTPEQLAGLNKIRNDSKGATTFAGTTIKLGADMIFNDGAIEKILSNGDSNKLWLTADESYPFEGTFDGQGHTVSGIYLKLDTNEGASAIQGIFGAVGKNATIKNLKLINSVVTGPAAVNDIKLGTLISRVVGDNANVTVSDVEIHSAVNEGGHNVGQVGGTVGGIVGAITDAGTLTLNNCKYYGSVSTTGRSAGGLIGAATNLKATVNIKDCQNNGSVTALSDAGGLIGTASLLALNVSGSENKGIITAPTCKGELYGYQAEAVDEKNGLRPKDTTLRVMSFNLFNNFDNYSTKGENRIDAIKQEIYFYSPDIVAVQEDYEDVLNNFSLSGYKRISPSTLSSGSSNCSIFYKSSLTKKASGSKYVTSDGTSKTVALTATDVISGNFKLTAEELSELKITSSTSNTDMRNLTTALSGTTKLIGPKQITWGVFTVDGKDVICVNVHLQHRSQNAKYSTPAVQRLRLMERMKQLELAQAQVNKLKETYPNAEVVYLGDFNDIVGTDTYLYLKNNHGYSSAHETAALRYGVSGTWNNAFIAADQGATGLTHRASERYSTSMLDFCFVSSGIKTLKFRVGAGIAMIGATQKVYTSDHRPIIADLYIGSALPSSLNAAPSVYSGSEDSTWYSESKTSFTLTTADQLMGFFALRRADTSFEGKTIMLGADMIINQKTLDELKAGGDDVTPLKATNSNYAFKGTFDGQGHSISGIYMLISNSYRSIFGGAAGNATFKNFVLENSYFESSTAENKSYLGCIVSRINDENATVTLTDITIAETVLMQESAYTTQYVGGFVGVIQNGTLTLNNCHFNGTISFAKSEHIAGFIGLTGANAVIKLNNCHGEGVISGKSYVAGLSGITTGTNTSGVNNGSCINFNNLLCGSSNFNASFK